MVGTADLLDLLAATFRVRRRHFGRQVQLYYLTNAKSGLCPEDCGYCSQSAVSDAKIPQYCFRNADELLAGAFKPGDLVELDIDDDGDVTVTTPKSGNKSTTKNEDEEPVAAEAE